MSMLLINDLEMSKQLDKNAMTALTGGHAAGTQSWTKLLNTSIQKKFIKGKLCFRSVKHYRKTTIKNFHKYGAWKCLSPFPLTAG